MLKSFDYYCDQNSKSQQEDTCVIDNKSLPDEKEEIRSKNLSQEEDLLAHQLAHTLRDGDTDRFIHIYDNCIPAHLSNTQIESIKEKSIELSDLPDAEFAHDCHVLDCLGCLPASVASATANNSLSDNQIDNSNKEKSALKQSNANKSLLLLMMDTKNEKETIKTNLSVDKITKNQLFFNDDNIQSIDDEDEDEYECATKTTSSAGNITLADKKLYSELMNDSIAATSPLKPMQTPSGSFKLPPLQGANTASSGNMSGAASGVSSAISRDGYVTNQRYQLLKENKHSAKQLTQCSDEVITLNEEQMGDESDHTASDDCSSTSKSRSASLSSSTSSLSQIQLVKQQQRQSCIINMNDEFDEDDEELGDYSEQSKYKFENMVKEKEQEKAYLLENKYEQEARLLRNLENECKYGTCSTTTTTNSSSSAATAATGSVFGGDSVSSLAGNPVRSREAISLIQKLSSKGPSNTSNTTQATTSTMASLASRSRASNVDHLKSDFNKNDEDDDDDQEEEENTRRVKSSQTSSATLGSSSQSNAKQSTSSTAMAANNYGQDVSGALLDDVIGKLISKQSSKHPVLKPSTTAASNSNNGTSLQFNNYKTSVEEVASFGILGNAGAGKYGTNSTAATSATTDDSKYWGYLNKKASTESATATSSSSSAKTKTTVGEKNLQLDSHGSSLTNSSKPEDDDMYMQDVDGDEDLSMHQQFQDDYDDDDDEEDDRNNNDDSNNDESSQTSPVHGASKKYNVNVKSTTTSGPRLKSSFMSDNKNILTNGKPMSSYLSGDSHLYQTIDELSDKHVTAAAEVESKQAVSSGNKVPTYLNSQTTKPSSASSSINAGGLFHQKYQNCAYKYSESSVNTESAKSTVRTSSNNNKKYKSKISPATSTVATTSAATSVNETAAPTEEAQVEKDPKVYSKHYTDDVDSLLQFITSSSNSNAGKQGAQSKQTVKSSNKSKQAPQQQQQSQLTSQSTKAKSKESKPPVSETSSKSKQQQPTKSNEVQTKNSDPPKNVVIERNEVINKQPTENIQVPVSTHDSNLDEMEEKLINSVLKASQEEAAKSGILPTTVAKSFSSLSLNSDLSEVNESQFVTVVKGRKIRPGPGNQQQQPPAPSQSNNKATNKQINKPSQASTKPTYQQPAKPAINSQPNQAVSSKPVSQVTTKPITSGISYNSAVKNKITTAESTPIQQHVSAPTSAPVATSNKEKFAEPNLVDEFPPLVPTTTSKPIESIKTQPVTESSSASTTTLVEDTNSTVAPIEPEPVVVNEIPVTIKKVVSEQVIKSVNTPTVTAPISKAPSSHAKSAPVIFLDELNKPAEQVKSSTTIKFGFIDDEDDDEVSITNTTSPNSASSANDDETDHELKNKKQKSKNQVVQLEDITFLSSTSALDAAQSGAKSRKHKYSKTKQKSFATTTTATNTNTSSITATTTTNSDSDEEGSRVAGGMSNSSLSHQPSQFVQSQNPATAMIQNIPGVFNNSSSSSQFDSASTSSKKYKNSNKSHTSKLASEKKMNNVGSNVSNEQSTQPQAMTSILPNTTPSVAPQMVLVPMIDPTMAYSNPAAPMANATPMLTSMPLGSYPYYSNMAQSQSVTPQAAMAPPSQSSYYPPYQYYYAPSHHAQYAFYSPYAAAGTSAGYSIAASPYIATASGYYPLTGYQTPYQQPMVPTNPNNVNNLAQADESNVVENKKPDNQTGVNEEATSSSSASSVSGTQDQSQAVNNQSDTVPANNIEPSSTASHLPSAINQQQPYIAPPVSVMPMPAYYDPTTGAGYIQSPPTGQPAAIVSMPATTIPPQVTSPTASNGYHTPSPSQTTAPGYSQAMYDSSRNPMIDHQTYQAENPTHLQGNNLKKNYKNNNQGKSNYANNKSNNNRHQNHQPSHSMAHQQPQQQQQQQIPSNYHYHPQMMNAGNIYQYPMYSGMSAAVAGHQVTNATAATASPYIQYSTAPQMTHSTVMIRPDGSMVPITYPIYNTPTANLAPAANPLMTGTGSSPTPPANNSTVA